MAGPGTWNPWTKISGPIPGLILTHTQMGPSISMSTLQGRGFRALARAKFKREPIWRWSLPTKKETRGRRRRSFGMSGVRDTRRSTCHAERRPSGSGNLPNAKMVGKTAAFDLPRHVAGLKRTETHVASIGGVSLPSDSKHPPVPIPLVHQPHASHNQNPVQK